MKYIYARILELKGRRTTSGAYTICRRYLVSHCDAKPVANRALIQSWATLFFYYCKNTFQLLGPGIESRTSCNHRTTRPHTQK